MVPDAETGADAPIVLFDGVCNLCNGWVRFALDHERRADPRNWKPEHGSTGTLRFASIQSQAGHDLMARHGLEPGNLDSVVYIADGRAHTRSDAVLRILGHLRAPWSWLRAFGVLPRFARDGAYRLVARSRYRIFGRRDVCPVPSPEIRARFLDT